MIDENGKISLPPDFLRRNKCSLIESNEQVTQNNTKCPNCSRVITISEVFTKSCSLENGIIIPAFDEIGVIIGKCSDCNKDFGVNVINPEFAEFNGGAEKVDYYFDTDCETKKDLYKDLLFSSTKVQGDEKLNQHYVNYTYDDYPLYVCNKCSKNLELLSLNTFKNHFDRFNNEHYNYVNWSLKNGRGQGPEYIIVKLSVECTCGNQCKSFFFKKYVESFNVEIEDFSICNITGSRKINEIISPGVYSKDNSVSWLYKLIPRWTLLFDKVYIITPFIGHQWLKSAELMNVWLELINRLDHKKSKVVLRYGQFSNFKKAYSKENKESYDRLSEFDLGSDLLSELKQANDFHAKIYCGISQDDCEVFSGSANLVKGKSMEVMHFNKYGKFEDFNKAFLSPLGVKEDLETNFNAYSLFFDSDNEFRYFGGKSEIRCSEYKNVILRNGN
ncbi:phospholipase D-like domain-containing protein [Alteromonas macleodii]|uniref:hypothetical protein n=1 Tax=Alteromonas macleodii TaxID=28108 RepID=UPI000C76F61D|nr:hypothetical protein [Alteromonas macleodii]